MHTDHVHRSRGAATALLILFAGVTACSGDDGTGAPTTTAAPNTTGLPSTPTTDAGDAAQDASEVGTTELLEYLNAEDATVGALYDWTTGDGVIAVTYLGTQTVQLYAAGELDDATALASCELASTYVFERDPTAEVQVYQGGYASGVKRVERIGTDGTCTVV